MAVDFPQSMIPQDQEGGSCKAFHGLTLGVRQRHFNCILLGRPDLSGRELHKGMMTSKYGSLGRLFGVQMSQRIGFLSFFFPSLHILWDLSSLTRNQTWAPWVKVPSPNYWTAREFLRVGFQHPNPRWEEGRVLGRRELMSRAQVCVENRSFSFDHIKI